MVKLTSKEFEDPAVMNSPLAGLLRYSFIVHGMLTWISSIRSTIFEKLSISVIILFIMTSSLFGMFSSLITQRQSSTFISPLLNRVRLWHVCITSACCQSLVVVNFPLNP